VRRTSLLLLAALSLAAAGCSPQAQTVVVTATPSPSPTAAPTPTRTPLPTPWQPVAPDEPCEPSATSSCQVLFVLPVSNYAGWAVEVFSDFEEAGYRVLVASDAESVVTPCGRTSHDIEVDLAQADVDVEDYDAIVYIGGYGCQSQWDDEEAHRIARDAVEREVVLGAIGCAPTILAHAGVLEGRETAVCQTDVPVKYGLDYCEVLEDLGAICVNRGMVRDGLIVTARPRLYPFASAVLETIASQGQ
jgi:protease I